MQRTQYKESNERVDVLKSISTVTPRACVYFPGVVSPVEEVFLWSGFLSRDETDDYLACGWRRSSWYFYRNSCPSCRRCIPIRIEVNLFKPSKSQRRVMRKNSNTVFKIFEPMSFAEKYIRESLEIYNRFLSHRYGKTPRTIEEYFTEYFFSPVETVVSAVFINGVLAGNGFLDRGNRSLSTVYFSFDPIFSDFSLGTFSVLKEIEWAREQGIRYYYLGYLIHDLSSMNYKSRFKPCEILDYKTGTWLQYHEDVPL